MKTEFSLEPSVISALNIMAEQQKRTPDEIIADLITTHYEAHSGELDQGILNDLREQHRAIGQAGAIDYEENGRAWITSWKTDKKLPVPPKCPV